MIQCLVLCEMFQDVRKFEVLNFRRTHNNVKTGRSILIIFKMH